MQTLETDFSDEKKEKLVYLIRDCGWPPHTAVKYLGIKVREAYSHLRAVDPKLANLAKNRHEQYEGIRNLTYCQTKVVDDAIKQDEVDLDEL